MNDRTHLTLRIERAADQAALDRTIAHIVPWIGEPDTLNVAAGPDPATLGGLTVDQLPAIATVEDVGLDTTSGLSGDLAPLPVAFEVYTDPVYEYLGDRAARRGLSGPVWRGECDAEGTPLLDAAHVEALLNDADGNFGRLADALRRAADLPSASALRAA